ncbi:hypothetical protein [Streptomyces bullii]|uniref:Uncharacterized protein n=1 Tax=Streptomyces bullii TaxID=349910 RepID=A0ABW0V508_9ACTN
MSEKYPGITPDEMREMRQFVDTAIRKRLQSELRSLAARIRADVKGQPAGADPGWRAGVEWTLLWVENTATQLTQDRS